MNFLLKTPYIKKIDLKKNNLLKASCTYLSFYNSGTFLHQAVRIRVKKAE
jgi:hypothetical protein